MKLYVDHDRYGEAPQFALVEAVHNSVRDLVRRKLKESGDDWASFVFGSSEKLITKADFEALDAKIVATGYRYSFTSMASVRDRPDIYKPAPVRRMPRAARCAALATMSAGVRPISAASPGISARASRSFTT